MEKGEGEEDINSILHNFTVKMSKIMNIDEVALDKPGTFVTLLDGRSIKQVTVEKKEGSNSFASLLRNPNNPAASKAVRLKVMNNSDSVEGAKVFETREGMEKALENGPWLIRLVPIFLNIWTPNTRLTKETITSAPIWVKMHNVPIVAYSETGLSLITSQLGRPIMLDAYTSTMCHSIETIEIEYEWVPPRCDSCKKFDHKDVDCPKRVKEPVANQVEDDGFTKVNRRNGKKKQNDVKQVAGIKFSKPKFNFQYRVVSKQPNNEESLGHNQNVQSSKNVDTEHTVNNSQSAESSSLNRTDDLSFLSTRNSFKSLMGKDALLEEADPPNAKSSMLNSDPSDDDEEEVEDAYNECDNIKGASTPSEDGKHV
ncbi:zinc knuckle CX2CX4HX4C containing protein [Tanacetum coccineum]